MQNGLTSRDVWAERFLGLVLLFLGSWIHYLYPEVDGTWGGLVDTATLSACILGSIIFAFSFYRGRSWAEYEADEPTKTGIAFTTFISVVLIIFHFWRLFLSPTAVFSIGGMTNFLPIEAKNAVVHNSNLTYPCASENAEEIVWVPTGGGTRYHKNPSCSGMESPKQMTVSEAISDGFSPCGKCW